MNDLVVRAKALVVEAIEKEKRGEISKEEVSFIQGEIQNLEHFLKNQRGATKFFAALNKRYTYSLNKSVVDGLNEMLTSLNELEKTVQQSEYQKEEHRYRMLVPSQGNESIGLQLKKTKLDIEREKLRIEKERLEMEIKNLQRNGEEIRLDRLKDKEK